MLSPEALYTSVELRMQTHWFRDFHRKIMPLYFWQFKSSIYIWDEKKTQLILVRWLASLYMRIISHICITFASYITSTSASILNERNWTFLVLNILSLFTVIMTIEMHNNDKLRHSSMFFTNAIVSRGKRIN